MGFAVAVNLFWAGILTVVFPRMIDAFTSTGAVAFFAYDFIHSEPHNAKQCTKILSVTGPSTLSLS